MSDTYKFSNMSEVEELAAPTENTKVFGFEDGKPVRMPASELGGKGLIFEITADDINSETELNGVEVIKNYDPLYEALMAGRHAVIIIGAGIFADSQPATNAVPVIWAVQEGVGFMTAIFTGDFVPLFFTNGSYHGAATTE